MTPTFHKINVHAAMTPAEIRKLFEPAFSQAQLLRDTYRQKMERIRSEESIAKRRESLASRRSLLSGASVATTITSSSSSSSTAEMEDMPFVTVSL